MLLLSQASQPTLAAFYKPGDVVIDVGCCEGSFAAKAAELGGRVVVVERTNGAAEMARDADVAIVCAGLSNLHEGGGHDRTTTDLPQSQLDLISAVTSANPRTESSPPAAGA